jgi:hypothetical protein
VFRYDEFSAWLSEIEAAAKLAPAKEPGRRWAPGMVMNTDPKGLVPPKTVARAPVLFGDLARARLRLAWRNDLLLPGSTTLDRRRREGGWGRLAVEMSRNAGGQWTGRALSRPASMIRDFEMNGPRVAS